MKKKVHIVSHTHWDREWYLPLENHKMRLVDLIDGIIEASKDNRFYSFQMDGHYLPIEDYLDVKPENREIVYELVRRGKIKIGPWYILQDAFLTSAESNVRNLEIGLRESQKIGSPAMMGYFPDTFGNIGQAPQILSKAGIKTAYFGRGVKATGFNNVVVEDFTSKNSELFWQSPDGSKVLSILFANWYCNGVDIPSQEDHLLKYMDRKIADMEKYAYTDQLLLMNGCDHSPVQKNIGEIIEKANKLYDKYEFVHSDLNTYADSVLKEIKEEDLVVVKGELRSQTTDGWGTLTNTSSSRYDLKKWNKTIEMRIEEVLQPLYAIFMDKKSYPTQKFDYIYKTLFTNHPHDSICGCSIDSVHDGNVRRFKDCMEGLDYLEDQVKIYFSKNIKNDSDDICFTVVNTTGYYQDKDCHVMINYDKRFFSGFEYVKIIKELEDLEVPVLEVRDGERSYRTVVKDLGVNFGYDIPEDSFRKGFYSRDLKVGFRCSLRPFEMKTFRLVKTSRQYEEAKRITANLIETDFYEIEFTEKGTFNLKDKRNKKYYNDILSLEDTGDIGNEYIYKQSFDGDVIESSKAKSLRILEKRDRYLVKIKEEMLIPKSAGEGLLDEQKKLVNVRDRKTKRSDRLEKLKISKNIIIKKDSPTIEIKIRVNNKMKDHRLRISFGHKLETRKLYAESIFEVAERDNRPPKTWENPDYSQNLNRFVQMRDRDGGFTIAGFGVQEYEDNKGRLYLTLFRSIGEMGDWGYFPTKDSQMIKKMDFDFYLDFFKEDYISSQQRVLAARVPYFTCQISKNTDGKIKENSVFEVDLKKNMFSTLYRNIKGERILRIYNPNEYRQDLGKIKAIPYNILGLERDTESFYNPDYLNPYEIRTLKLED